MASDLISRKALLERLEKIYGTNSIVDKIMLRFLKKLIRKQPTVDRWIPCSDRLPENGRTVLATLVHTYEPDYRDYGIARYVEFDNGERHWYENHHGYLEWDKYSDGKGGCSLYKVIAWMPLPEPYKAGDIDG